MSFTDPLSVESHNFRLTLIDGSLHHLPCISFLAISGDFKVQIILKDHHTQRSIVTQFFLKTCIKLTLTTTQLLLHKAFASMTSTTLHCQLATDPDKLLHDTVTALMSFTDPLSVENHNFRLTLVDGSLHHHQNEVQKEGSLSR